MITKRKNLNSVILIDDNECDNFLHREILEQCGATNIQIFESPLTALKYLQQTKDVPQLIMLDINLPIMNGFVFLEKFRELKISQHPIEIIMLSATSNPVGIKKAKEKCSGFIAKFLTEKKLMTQLQSLDSLK